MCMQNATASTDIYTLSLHDALPICGHGETNQQEEHPDHQRSVQDGVRFQAGLHRLETVRASRRVAGRSEEHTSELQSRLHLVCRLLLEKKKEVSGKLRIECASVFPA